MSTKKAPSTFSRRELLLTTAVAISPSLVKAQDSVEIHSPASSSRLHARFDLERFVDDCRIANLESDSQEAVKEVIRQSMENPDEVLAVVGEPKQAGIHPIYRADDLTILNIVWSPLMQLMPHEHNMWALLGVYTGREDNILWEKVGASISANKAMSLVRGNTASLADDVIHSVVNPIQKFTGAIHVYGGDFFAEPKSEWDPETLKESEWDIDKARRIFKEFNDRALVWESYQNSL